MDVVIFSIFGAIFGFLIFYFLIQSAVKAALWQHHERVEASKNVESSKPQETA